MTTKYHWDEQVTDNIDWLLHGIALQAIPIITKKSTIQFIHKWLPVLAHPGQQIFTQKLCPMCQREDESQDHYLTCIEPTTSWNKEIENIFTNQQTQHGHHKIHNLPQWAVTHCRSTQTTGRTDQR